MLTSRRHNVRQFVRMMRIAMPIVTVIRMDAHWIYPMVRSAMKTLTASATIAAMVIVAIRVIVVRSQRIVLPVMLPLRRVVITPIVKAVESTRCV